MTSKFLLDPRFLDDCVSDATPDVEILEEAAAYFTLPNHKEANYAFSLESIARNRIPSSLLELKVPHTEREAPRSFRLNYQKANILFLPVETFRQYADDIIKECEALYVCGKFLKGDAGTFKQYGITIL